MVLSRYITSEIVKPMFLGIGLLVIVFTGYSTAIRLGDASNGLIQLPMVARLDKSGSRPESANEARFREVLPGCGSVSIAAPHSWSNPLNE